MTAASAWRTPVVVLTAGGIVLLITMGLRQTYGLFLSPVTADLGWSREAFAFAIAIQNLFWGLTQPFAGAIADRYGSARVVVFGAVLYAAGVWLSAQTETVLGFNLSAGLLVGMGMGCTGFGVVLAVMARAVAPERRSFALGIGTAAGSLGQFMLVPLGQSFISAYGWPTAFLLLGCTAVLMVPLASALTGRPASLGPQQSLGEALSEALRHPGFCLLTAGFFVCGFQLAFIGNHLPAYLTDNGIDPAMGAIAIATIGLFNVGGSIAAGMLGARQRKKYLLALLYLGRGLAIAGFMLLPLSNASVLLFSAIMGLFWLSPVPLTTGLIGQIFGIRYLAMLNGVVFFSHQIGSFLGVWLGGLLYDRTGSYDVVWWASVVLSVMAALLNWPIDDRAVSRSPAPV